MRLTKSFHLDEFLVSQTAERNGIDMTPPPEVVQNLIRLCGDVLQPLRDAVKKPVVISSGYRPLLLNQLIGGSITSAHMTGRAADFTIPGLTPLVVCQIIVELQLDYDQVIHEFGRWVHVGVAETPRHESLTAYRKGGRTHYVHGIKTMEEVM